tara:strand:- start:5545 stop:5685 length:141 start_codon:yes stop_codon:yes gene_type:complete
MTDFIEIRSVFFTRFYLEIQKKAVLSVAVYPAIIPVLQNHKNAYKA